MTEAKSTAKKSIASKAPKAKPKKPLVAFRCLHPNHDQTHPWELSVANKAHRVVVKGTQRGGAESGVVYEPVCPACSKSAKKAAGLDERGGSVAVDVSDLEPLA